MEKTYYHREEMNIEMTIEHKGTIIFESDRLFLRKLTAEDAHEMFETWCSDDNVTRYLPWKTHENIEITKTILNEWISKYESKDFYQWGIELKDYNKLIGTISVVSNDDELSSVEIGYCIGSKYWGHGYVAEALNKVVDFLQKIGYIRITAKHHIGNPKSGSVLRKCGFIEEGTLHKYCKDNIGNLVDVKIYAKIS